MNQRQLLFVKHAMRLLQRVISVGAQNGKSSELVGHKRVGAHRVVVKLVAERETGFSAPLGSHASSLTAPPRNIKTSHKNRSRKNRWQKSVF